MQVLGKSKIGLKIEWLLKKKRAVLTKALSGSRFAEMLNEDDEARLVEARNEQKRYNNLSQAEKDRLEERRDALVARDMVGAEYEEMDYDQ